MFIDVTWIKTNMVPIRGWGAKGGRLRLHSILIQKHGRPKAIDECAESKDRDGCIALPGIFRNTIRSHYVVVDPGNPG